MEVVEGPKEYLKIIAAWAGRILLVASGLLLSMDFLPIDSWQIVSDFVAGKESHTFFKVVAVPSSALGREFVAILAGALGVFLILLAKFVFTTKRGVKL